MVQWDSICSNPNYPRYIGIDDAFQQLISAGEDKRFHNFYTTLVCPVCSSSRTYKAEDYIQTRCQDATVQGIIDYHVSHSSLL